MASVQNDYNFKDELPEITKWKEKVREVFSKNSYRCCTCGETDYDIVHPKASTTAGEVQVNCKRCGRKHYFDLERLSKYVGEHHG